MKKRLGVVAAVAVVLLVSAPVFAYHDGGAAKCEGCHTMHNSLGGVAMKSFAPVGVSGVYLLQGNQPSSVCLNCHQVSSDTGPNTYHVSSDSTVNTLPLQSTPAGDFMWLKKAYGTSNKANNHGHNINSTDYGYTTDTDRATAPGGTYPSASLSCASCHDPHGRYRRDSTGAVSTTGSAIKGSGSYYDALNTPGAGEATGVYRLLAGVGYQPKSLVGSYAFVNGPPIALAPSNYNRTETGATGTDVRVVYGSGMSEWCSNCHPAMHESSYTSGTNGLVHPAGNGAKLTATVVTNYNAYLGTGKLTGVQASSYSSLTPFETGDTTVAAAVTSSATPAAGPSTSSNVMCLSCHRAHASGFTSMTRFSTQQLTTLAGAYIDPSATTDPEHYTAASGMPIADQQRAYYERPATAFPNYQRPLCNKCHAKD